MNLPDHIAEKRTRAFTLLSSESVPPAVRDEQRDRVDRVIRLTHELSSTTSFETELANHIREAWRAAKRGDRTEPRCTCGSPNCSLLEGEVPSALRSRGLRSRDTQEEAERFVMDHPGDPRVVVEVLEERREKLAQLYQEIETLHGALQSGREERRRDMGATPSSSSTSSTSDQEASGD